MKLWVRQTVTQMTLTLLSASLSSLILHSTISSYLLVNLNSLDTCKVLSLVHTSWYQAINQRFYIENETISFHILKMSPPRITIKAQHVHYLTESPSVDLLTVWVSCSDWEDCSVRTGLHAAMLTHTLPPSLLPVPQCHALSFSKTNKSSPAAVSPSEENHS